MSQKIHLLVVDMGYGHQRAAYPLLSWSFEGNLNLNEYDGASLWERKYWKNSRTAYERISYFKKVPLLGGVIFNIMDYFQRIEPFYPKRSLKKQSLQQKMFFKAVKKGVGKNLINQLNNNPLPLVTSFFVAAYSAEYYQYKGPIYCIVCDADISRAWAPINPETSKIKYFASNLRTKKRLMMYGVKEENIIISGFPLPLENKGDNELNLKKDLSDRLKSLDPKLIFINKNFSLLEKENLQLSENLNKIFTLTFAVGGAGAQRELAYNIVKKLKKELKEKKIKINLVAGSREDVYLYFKDKIKELGLDTLDNLQIVYHPQKVEYFRLFNLCLRDTDVLWTKPSELSFYTALGLPIIMSEPVGSQEHFNREWLLEIGSGIDALAIDSVSEWLFDWRQNGRLARAAFNGYFYAPRQGTENIIKEILNNQ